jgi:hypothetical protein
MEVLETMRNLIVELQVFKVDNEKLKKAQQEQEEINEVLLCSIVTKKIPNDTNHDEEVRKRASKNSGPETEKGDSSSEGTPSAKNKTKTDRKRKEIDHLEGEFKKIKPTTFDGESRTGEETEAWLLDIKKYFQIYNYSSNMKVRMVICNMKGKVRIWNKEVCRQLPRAIKVLGMWRASSKEELAHLNSANITVVHNLQEVSMVGDVGKNLHRLNAAIDGRQADHHSSVVEIEGKINNSRTSILIDPRSRLSYITPDVVESNKLKKLKHAKSWLVQLATKTKRKVIEFIYDFEFI